jgi:hypothetical protein
MITAFRNEDVTYLVLPYIEFDHFEVSFFFKIRRKLFLLNILVFSIGYISYYDITGLKALYIRVVHWTKACA